MSAPSFINLPQYNVLTVEEGEHDYHVYVEPAKPVMVCQHCGSVNVGKWGNAEQVVRDLPSHGKRVSLYIRTQRLRCEDCSRTAFEPLPVLAEGRRMTRRLVAWIGVQSLKRVFAAIAEETGVDEKTVRNIFKDYVHEMEVATKFETPRWLGIDEIHVLKRPRCVLTNIETRTIIDMLADRSKATVAQRLFALHKKSNIRYVTMDMERRGLMHDRFILLKRERELDVQSRFLLDSWTTLHPDLGTAYRLKEDFYGIYDAKTKAEATARQAAWAASIPASVEDAFKPLTTAWKNWHPEILNYFDHRLTNAYTESLNSLIRCANRAGRGYSFEALRAKILYTEGFHKVERPKWERRANLRREVSAFMAYSDSVGMMTPDEHFEGVNYGTDISTLTRRIESGQF